MTDDGQRLAGGFDHGAVRHGDVVRRISGPWTPSVHRLLRFLQDEGFAGAPRPISIRPDGTDEVSFLPGDTVSARFPWPAWTHSEQALVDAAVWLREYHAVVSRFPIDDGMTWREHHASGGDDVIVAHNDAGPYNAVWDGRHLAGFIDWDMAGPRSRVDDLLWTAFSWVPLHARHVIAREGFTDFDSRGARLRRFLAAYGTDLDPHDAVRRIDGLLEAQIALVRRKADDGDATYRRIIAVGRVDDLAVARIDLATVAL